MPLPKEIGEDIKFLQLRLNQAILTFESANPDLRVVRLEPVRQNIGNDKTILKTVQFVIELNA